MKRERRAEVLQLLAATTRHLAAKERGENSNLGYAKVRRLDVNGEAIGPWKELGPVSISFSAEEIDPEFIRLITGEGEVE